MSRRQNTREFDRQKAQEIAEKLGLDPELNLVIMLKGQPYIRANGVYLIAMSKGDFEGCEVDLVESDHAKQIYVAKARCWRKGRAKAFEDYGDANAKNSPNQSMSGTTLIRIACTRAKLRAIRTAYDIGIYSVEEMDTQFHKEVSAQDAEPTQGTKPSNRQQESFYPSDRWKGAVQDFRKAYRDQNYTDSEAQFILRRKTGNESTRECSDVALIRLANEISAGLTSEEQSWLLQMADALQKDGRKDANEMLKVAQKHRPQVECKLRQMLATLDHQEAEQEEIGQKKAA